MTSINTTTSAVNVIGTNNPNNWNAPIDLMRLDCITNYDLPLDTKFIWMYFYNLKTGLTEIWHRNLADISPDSIYQIFINNNYNSLTYRNATISQFIKMLLLNQFNSIDLQCASYCNNQLVAKSNNLTLIRGNNTFATANATPVDNTALIVGAVLGSLLGFLLLLGLILLLAYCCCCRKRKNKNLQKMTIINNEETDAHSVIVPYTVISNSNTKSNNISKIVPVTSLNVNYLNDFEADKVDRSIQFSNQLDLSKSNQLNLSKSNQLNLSNSNRQRTESFTNVESHTTETETVKTETIRTIHPVEPSLFYKMSNLPFESTTSYNTSNFLDSIGNMNKEDTFDYRKYETNDGVVKSAKKPTLNDEEFYYHEEKRYFNDSLPPKQKPRLKSTNLQFV